jgi:hypothetical protein
LDYFLARYFSGPQGRFTSADPENIGSSASDPQSWNAYAYVRNNPLRFTDPDGLRYRVCGSDEKDCHDLDDPMFGEFQRTYPYVFSGGKIYAKEEGGGKGQLLGTYEDLGRDSAFEFADALLNRVGGSGEALAGALAKTTVQNIAFALAGPILGIVADTGIGSAAAKSLWPSPGEGRQIINGIEYTVHALDRMAPKGLIQQGTEMYSRGVPPSVVENAIKHGTTSAGNLPGTVVHIFENVRVITNQAGNRVISVITTGR